MAHLGTGGWSLPATSSRPEPGPPEKMNGQALDPEMLSSSHLVDQTHEISVGPASLVQVVRLLQHLRQLLASNIPVERQVRTMMESGKLTGGSWTISRWWRAAGNDQT